MPRIPTPAPYTSSEAAAIGLATIANLRYFHTIDSHRVVVHTGRTIDPCSDSLPDRAKALIHWLIALEYLEIAPSRYKSRLILKRHSRFSNSEEAIDAFRDQFRSALAAHTAARKARDERLAAMPTIAYQQKLEQLRA